MSKILIIEDETDIAKLLVKRLSLNKYETVCASDAYQGIQFAHNARPDLIILDLMLPAGGGLMVLRNLRMTADTVTVPVVVLTGMKDPEYKKKIMEEGVDAYLGKPYDAEELIRVINNILQDRQKG